jgi:2-polyprenyl-6-hydroxyphenyl methylase/3-demethylubiquinone-9 3-methyltransferase
MAAANILKQRESHFEFGKNWGSFTELVDEQRIKQAEESLRRLVEVEGKSFMDIGSGSGLFSVAALNLGASRVSAIDIDEHSVAATTKLLEKYATSRKKDWRASQTSVFDLDPAAHGQFDVVYSWGVLHHTGAMWEALEAASRMVAPGGALVVALYEQTPLCGLWTVEKRLYSRAPRLVQRALQVAYVSAYGLGLMVSGRNPIRIIRENRSRGMDTMHDVHDWLGGYPYESTGEKALTKFFSGLGFSLQSNNSVQVHMWGILGTGCSEYVYVRKPA